ncbi:dihydrofolate reductase family protein [Spirosoma foliorum]|uniref:Dihydrofolate reductase family protein n=1 Tax=Spirosoma foliorum TaxID=2710596 RepID=A0A7G5GP12_9BACT|nr:dihydrofolate reductase family protein [Spirosoma foliorum]QMW00604.1 dihydrofolate reductase family protein [Spirosoma foliorum]
MRKVILFMHMSLDGFVCGPNGEQDWKTMNDDDMGKYLAADFQSTVDTILTGRVLYQGFASFWPSVPSSPGIPAELVDFGNWMNNTRKIVFSKTLQTVDWTNSVLAERDIVDEINYLKQQPGGDMVVFGGATFVAALAEQNLIDEYRIKLEPILLGDGKALFKDVHDRTKLTLTKAKAFNSGVVGLYYQVTT